MPLPLLRLMVLLLLPPLGQSTGSDLLDSGVVFKGQATFDRGGSDTKTVFTVSSPSKEVVLVTVSKERAISSATVDSMSYEWAQLLTKSSDVSIRIAALAELKIGGAVAPGSLQHVAICTPPKAMERTETYITFALETCIAFDEKRRWFSDKGNPQNEMTVVVAVPNSLPSAASLSGLSDKPRVYVRLEPTK